MIYFKGLGMRNLQYEMRVCQKKVIINSQRQFMYGSNFFESEFNILYDPLILGQFLDLISPAKINISEPRFKS